MKGCNHTKGFHRTKRHPRKGEGVTKKNRVGAAEHGRVLVIGWMDFGGGEAVWWIVPGGEWGRGCTHEGRGGCTHPIMFHEGRGGVYSSHPSTPPAATPYRDESPPPPSPRSLPPPPSLSSPTAMHDMDITPCLPTPLPTPSPYPLLPPLPPSAPFPPPPLPRSQDNILKQTHHDLQPNILSVRVR